MARKVFLTLLIGFFLMTLAGCETMHGFGKDLKKLGDKIEKKAEN